MSGTARIDLATTAPFRIGALCVEPALRQVSIYTTPPETLEPRVMLVLVALARAGGAIVSRDQLIEQCWDSRIVGDDSINRVISRLRKLASAHGDGLFSIETISKVGYRLVAADGLLAASPNDRGATIGTARAVDQLVAPVVPVAPADSPAKPRRWRWVALIVAPLVLGGGLAWMPWRVPSEQTLTIAPIKTVGVSPQAAQVFDGQLRATLGDASVALSSEGKGLVARATMTSVADGIMLATTIEEARSQVLWTGEKSLSSKDPATIRDAARGAAGMLQCAMMGANDPSQPDPAVMSRWLTLCADDTSLPGRRLQLAHEIVAKNPRFAPAWLSIEQDSGLIVLHPGQSDPVEARRDGLSAFARFKALRPDASDGYSYAAVLTDQHRPAEREALLRKAAHLKFLECPCALAFLGDFLLQSGKSDESVTFYRRALDQNPNDESHVWRLFMAAQISGRDQLAGQQLARWIEITAAHVDDHHSWGLLRVALWRHDWKGAAIQLARSNQPPTVVAAVNALVSGDRAAMARAAEGFANRPEHETDAAFDVPILAQLGAIDQAFATLDRDLAHNGQLSAPGWAAGIAQPMLFDPNNRPLWNDPRFADYLRRAGYIAYWRASGVQPDLCHDTNRPAFCSRI